MSTATPHRPPRPSHRTLATLAGAGLLAATLSGCSQQTTEMACGLIEQADLPGLVQDAFASLDTGALPEELAVVGSAITGLGELVTHGEVGEALSGLGSAWESFATAATAELLSESDQQALSTAATELSAAVAGVQQACTPDEG